LWPLVARLQARAAEGHLEQVTLTDREINRG
jgi:hypothetical protein